MHGKPRPVPTGLQRPQDKLAPVWCGQLPTRAGVGGMVGGPCHGSRSRVALLQVSPESSPVLYGAPMARASILGRRLGSGLQAF